MDLTEAILHITAAVHCEFGENYVVVTTDGLEVKDSVGTQGILDTYILSFCSLIISFNAGLRFWKVNSRTFFAVPDEDLAAPTNKRRRTQIQMTCSGREGGADLEESVKAMWDELGALASKMEKLFSFTKDTRVPPGIRMLLTDALKCKICFQAPVEPPIILAMCCKSILGCQECVDEWYADGGLNKSCPARRSPRGLSETMILLGLNELAQGVTDILETA